MIYIALVLAVIGVWILLHGLVHCRKHPIKGLFRCTCGLVPLLAGVVLILLAINLQTYARLVSEQPVADLHFERVADQRYTVSMTYPDGRLERYQIEGDDWRLEAQFLKWKGWATVLGLEPQFRLERLAGRYHDIDQERRAEHSVIALSAQNGLPEELDLWAFAKRRPHWVPMIDASYGSATYLPMRNGTSYAVTVTNSGLIAREVAAN